MHTTAMWTVRGPRRDTVAPTGDRVRPIAILAPMSQHSGGPASGPRVLTRRVSWFLFAFGAWSWFVWITFVRNLWKDGSGLAFDDAGDPTGYFWVHLALAVVSFLLGSAIGWIGWRALRAPAATRGGTGRAAGPAGGTP